MKTTLNKIREHNPCEKSWKKLLQSIGKTEADDTEVTVRYIFDILGVWDALWVLRAVDGYDREIRLFACDCAESALYSFEDKFPDDNRPRNAIEVARRFANSEATCDELNAAQHAAGDAAVAAEDDRAAAAASRAASRAALWAASWAALWAAEAAAENAAKRKKQRDFLLKYI